MQNGLTRFYLLGGCLSLLVLGCSQGSANRDLTLLEPGADANKVVELAPVDPEELVTVALVMKTLTNPFFKEMEKGARRAEDELGIRLLVKTASEETSIEQQIAIVDNLIKENVSAIVIAPGDSIELVPILKKAQDAGIVIVNIDNRLDPQYAAEFELHHVPFISVNNEQAAYLSAQTLSADITEPAKVAILEGIRSAENAESRKAGALRAFRENPKITDILMETANWKIDEAYQVTQALVEQHPDITAIFCANDMMALGALQYLQEANRGDIAVAGFDALDKAIDAIRAGQVVATVDQQAAEQGYLGITYALKALSGEAVPQEVMVDIKLVTADQISVEAD